MHPRAAIRHAVRDALLGKTSAGQRVYASRVLPHRKRELPAIVVYTPEEQATADVSSRELTRELPVIVEAYVEPGENPDDAMDALAQEIETALHADPYFGGTAAESFLVSTDMEVIEEGDRLTGFVALTYTATYYVRAPEPPAAEDLDDFRTVDTVYQPNGAGADDIAEDHFAVQEVPSES